MKKLILALGMFLAVQVSAQEKKVTQVITNWLTFDSDDHKEAHFDVYHTDVDQMVAALKTTLGTPVSETPGVVKWEQLNIEGVGENVSLVFYDGVARQQKNCLKVTNFKEKENKAEVLAQLKDGEYRVSSLEIHDDKGNMIRTEALASSALKYTRELVKDFPAKQ